MVSPCFTPGVGVLPEQIAGGSRQDGHHRQRPATQFGEGHSRLAEQVSHRIGFEGDRQIREIAHIRRLLCVDLDRVDEKTQRVGIDARGKPAMHTAGQPRLEPRERLTLSFDEGVGTRRRRRLGAFVQPHITDDENVLKRGLLRLQC